MIWKDEIEMEIKSYSKHHIDTVVQNNEESSWRCTGVYGNPKSEETKHTWELIRRLSSLSSIPWICFGDFNEILHLREKIEGNVRNVRLITAFREAINDSGLTDLDYKWYPFTWCNRRFGPHIIEERLDRAFCCKNWGRVFQELLVKHIETWSSDHYLIIMEVVERGSRTRYEKKAFPRMHYENMYSPYEKYQEIVKREWWEQSIWEGVDAIEVFKKATKKFMADIKLWSSTEFRGKEREVKQLIKELKNLKRNYDHYVNGDRIRGLENHIDNLLADDEVYLSRGLEPTGFWREIKIQNFFMPKLQRENKRIKFGEL